MKRTSLRAVLSTGKPSRRPGGRADASFDATNAFDVFITVVAPESLVIAGTTDFAAVGAEELDVISRRVVRLVAVRADFQLEGRQVGAQ